MGRKTIGEAPEETVDEYGSEAEELGISRAKYARHCIEVGRLVFQSSGEMNIERLRDLSEDTGTASIDSSLNTVEGDIQESILSNLPTDEHRALTKEEIRRAVFGTKEEQAEQIMKALKQLSNKKAIRPLVDDGYVRTNE
jgi:hypothetical protein